MEIRDPILILVRDLWMSCFASYFYSYTSEYSQVPPIFGGNITIDAYRALCTCSTPAHMANEDSSDIFLIHPRYSTVLYRVPPDRTMMTWSIVLQFACTDGHGHDSDSTTIRGSWFTEYSGFYRLLEVRWKLYPTAIQGQYLWKENPFTMTLKAISNNIFVDLACQDVWIKTSTSMRPRCVRWLSSWHTLIMRV